MHYFRNFELAKQYHVSQTAVGKWIESAKNGKLDLELVEDGTKSYIAATSKNRAIIEGVIESRKKYFNGKSHKVVEPTQKFYTTYMPEHIYDILLNLDREAEIPLQYVYFGEGAKYWNDRLKYMLNENIASSSTRIVDQLIINRSFLDAILNDYNLINVIDVGAGNAYPAKELLTHIKKQNKLGYYCAIDISPEMLYIAETNIKEWFGETIQFKADVRDVTYEHFDDLIIHTTPTDNSKGNVNLVLFVGGSLGNFSDQASVLRTIYRSLNPNDILIYSLKLDTDNNRRVFDVSGVDNNQLAPNIKALVDNLGIKESFYTVETGYDETQKERFARIRLKVALTIVFNLPQGERVVNFKKDDSILLWRYKHQTAEEITQQFTNSGFNILHSSQTPDHEFMLLICDLKTNRRR